MALRSRTVRLVASCGVGSAVFFSLVMLAVEHRDLVLKGLAALGAAAEAAIIALGVAFVWLVTLGQQHLGYDALLWLFILGWMSCVLYKMERSDDYADSTIARIYYSSIIPSVALAACWGVHLFRWNEALPKADQMDAFLTTVSIASAMIGSFFTTFFMVFGFLGNAALERIGNGRPHPGRAHQRHVPASEAHLRIEKDWTQRFRRQAMERERAQKWARTSSDQPDQSGAPSEGKDS